MASLITSHTVDARPQIVARLAEQIRRGGQPLGEVDEGLLVSSGARELDALLPRGGFVRGSFVEWIAARPGAGATLLALKVAQAACGHEGHWAVIDGERNFFPPAAAALGLSLARLLVVRPTRGADVLWAADQVFRCNGVAAALAWPGTLDHRALRRWQLAVEESRVLGLLVRPREVLTEPSWAEARLLVEPLPTTDDQRRWRIEVVHARGGWGGRTVEVALHYETGKLRTYHSQQPVRLVSPLARRAPATRAAGA